MLPEHCHSQEIGLHARQDHIGERRFGFVVEGKAFLRRRSSLREVTKGLQCDAVTCSAVS